MNRRQQKKQAKRGPEAPAPPATISLMRTEPSPLVEICRSVSRKINLGNYESIDFFCSIKSEVPFESQEDASAALHDWCKSQIRRDIATYTVERREGKL